jgi:hypothetical protein
VNSVNVAPSIAYSCVTSAASSTLSLEVPETSGTTSPSSDANAQT